jgi:hypothetical protein
MRPDIVVSWPRNTDYPLWRQMIRDRRSNFNEVIIVFTETNQGEDYREFIKTAMFQDHVLVVESPEVPSGDDWRNVAVNAGLMHSLHSEWIWFTEEDFFPTSEFFDFIDITSQDPSVKVFGVYDGDRLHPCSIHMKRTLLNQTRKLFGIVPDKSDHFSLLQKDIERLSLDPQNGVAIIPKHLYKHMAGLSHNMRLIADGRAPNHKKEEFDFYLWECLRVDVPLPDHFGKLLKSYLGV